MNVKAFKILRSTSLDDLEVQILEHIGDKWDMYGNRNSTVIKTFPGPGGETHYINEYSQAVYQFKD